jgi:Family of unknown function (DUF6789)
MSRTLRLVERGMLAGLVATTALSVVLLLKQLIGLMPQLDLVTVLAHALGERSPVVGWVSNYFVGVFLWGPAFVWADRKMFFTHTFNGLMFGSIVWLGVMFIIMPLAGEGLFGLNLGLVTPTLTLFLHWLYGAVLGATYGRLVRQPSHGDSGFTTPRHA